MGPPTISGECQAGHAAKMGRIFPVNRSVLEMMLATIIKFKDISVVTAITFLMAKVKKKLKCKSYV